MGLSLRVFVLLVVCLLFLRIPAAPGDEGMWLFNNPPKKYLQETYGFDATDKWLDHVQKSSVRFNSGGSGSLVSADGLVLTNHHVATDALQKMSTDEQHNYVRDGFLARTRAEEHKCEAMEINVLLSIEDVTDKVRGAVKAGMSNDEAFRARRAAMAKIEKEDLQGKDDSKFRSDVVTLYQGAQYHLYRFRKYTDVRLVFAPEYQIAFFGGDPDNFEYPRFDLDMALFRVYEDDKPIHPEHYLKWSKHGVKDGELVFVSGHPGRTSRQSTVAELEFMRDLGHPYTLQRLNRLEVLLAAYAVRDENNERKAHELLFGVRNSRKARLGGLAGLLDPELMRQKVEQESKLRQLAATRDELKSAQDAWDKIAAAEKERREILHRFTLLERGAGLQSDLFGIARTLVRAAAELPKPNGERLREFRDSNLDSLKHSLFSNEPIYEDFEILKLADALTFLCAQLGYQDTLVQQVLAGKSPEDRAKELVRGTKLKDVEVRKQLYKGGKQAVDAANDPMIALAQAVDAEARRLRKIDETQVDEPERQGYAQIARVAFAQEGTKTYPDATFTLRLSFGVVKGYEEDGKHIPFETTMAGLYERSAKHHDKEPFNLPPTWVKAKDKLNLHTPFNFVCTADIIGGNSGSPVVNRDAELVGLIFDGNIQSLVLDFAYTDKQARAVSVCSQAMPEALRKVYDAGFLADELEGKGTK